MQRSSEGGAGVNEPAVATIPALDPGQHGLARNSIGLLQSVIISIANSAPTAAMTVTFAAIGTFQPAAVQ